MKKKTTVVLLSALSLGFAGEAALRRRLMRAQLREQKQAKKYEAMMLLFQRWLAVRQDHSTLASYFERNGYRTIAIYGMGDAGERLKKELEAGPVVVRYVVDQREDIRCPGVIRYAPEEDLPQVDAMVVTAILSYDEIRKKLAGRVGFPILSLEDIVYEV